MEVWELNMYMKWCMYTVTLCDYKFIKDLKDLLISQQAKLMQKKNIWSVQKHIINS